MFDQDYFTEPQDAGPGRSGRVVGEAGSWLLHAAKVAFLIYSGYHGINATMSYHGTSELAMTAGIVGIVVTEIVLLGLYLAWHNQKITGAAQSITAGVVYLIGFVIACLAIVVDSQINAGMELASWLDSYLRWMLPVAPAVMALGAVLVHVLAPKQLRGRKEAAAIDRFDEDQFNAHMATRRAEMDTAKMIKNMQLNTRMATAKQIAQAYSGDDVQRAIASTAKQNIPALLRAIGVNVEDVPDVNNNGELDAADVQAYIESLQRQRPAGEPIIINPNGDGANFTNGRGDGR
jgi:hypothetical protein